MTQWIYMGDPFTRPLETEETDVLEAVEPGYGLVLWNDDVNTFDWVIISLMEICRHTREQAEQSALLVHTQGKYMVKEDTYEILKPMCEAILDRGISATIEPLGQ